MAIMHGHLSCEANELLARGLPPGIDGPARVERTSTRDRHAEAQAKAKAEARAKLAEAYGGKIPNRLPGACWPPGHPLAPKPKETIAPAESPATGVK